ncbi:hypothetical protein [Kribbella sp. CA-247076]|uniref:hypothetical protein n=1 Tax=Kribbella sp. CA-247076 TaxID=3239941 RepID=UPI003D930807
MDRLPDIARTRLMDARRRPQRRRTLRELGLSDADIRRLVRRRELQHHHGFYIDGGLDEELAAIACARASYPGSVISHLSAAGLAGLRTWTDSRRPNASPADAVWLTRPPNAKRNQRRPDIVVRRAGLPPYDVTRSLWLPVTTVARTVVDLARELEFREAIVTIDHALRTGTPIEALTAVLDLQHHWPGVRRARTAIAFGDPRSESALESIARAAFAAAGLPAPVLQVQFFDGFRWLPERVDFWWPWFRTVGEADGLAKYDGDTPEERRRRLRQSHLRDQRLSDRGVELVHFGWEDVVVNPLALAGRFRAAFRRGAARTGDEPTWRSLTPNPHAA